MNVIIAAAGTGGHINPGIAIANKIKEKNKDAKITFIGTIRGLENDLVPRAGYSLEKIEAYGISRKISFSNIKHILKTINSIKEAKKIIKKIKPDIVIGTGGYICGPVLLAANKCKIPTILHESNAYPGVAVKLLSNKVNTILVGFEDAKKRLPKAKKVVITGTPTKLQKMNLSIEESKRLKEQLRIKSNLPIVLAFGGSQGAQSINNSLINIIKNKLNEKYHIIWAVGQKQYEEVRSQLEDINLNINNIKNVSILPYIYNMQEVMNLADVVVARSGAMTITETAIVGKPAIFVPFPFATENHQEYNARVLADRGAAKIILDKNLNSDILNEEILKIVLDKNLQKEMGEKAARTAVPNVEDKIYKEIEMLMKL